MFRAYILEILTLRKKPAFSCGFLDQITEKTKIKPHGIYTKAHFDNCV